ncbi:MAG TPA: molybdopterin molybdotransferase MoeA [Streptosporangiaceae bacterium]|nr:molybdopterin molybdotransferase MoeA [Streptosporangiaceae bacterium]
MPRAAAPGPRPSPDAAYSQWINACTAAGWRGTPAAERVPVRDGLGRVTTAPVRARWPAPRFASAAMDGIAIKAGPAEQVGVWQLDASSFAWVDTGDPIPAGLDTVVERERVQSGADGSAQITGPAPRGLNVRATGEDFPAGELLIPAGHRLRPADLAGAAAAGHATLEVARRPAAAIIPTGDEIRPAGSALAPGDVTDSNSFLLAARVEETGARPLVSDVQPDDPDAIAAEIRRTALAADLVLVIAGSSAGRSDHTAAVMARVGGLAVRGVAVRPGHPVLLGYALPDQARAAGGATAVPVIGIPGYPLAAAVIFELFAVPLIAALQGRDPADRVWQRAQLACDWVSSPDVEDWVPVSLAAAPAGGNSGCPIVATPGRRGAGSISRLMRAHAWWPIPIGKGKFARGELIDVQPISRGSP